MQYSGKDFVQFSAVGNKANTPEAQFVWVHPKLVFGVMEDGCTGSYIISTAGADIHVSERPELVIQRLRYFSEKS